MKISKTLTTVLIIIAAVLILIWWGSRMFNGIVAAQEETEKAWANVESVYQRRADLIGNLVQTVQGAADFERSTLAEVIEARANATSVKIDPTQLTEDNLTVFQKAQDQLSGALSRLLVTVERYPDLKATQNFRDFQVQLEGTENRINVERQKFNEVVQKYNTMIRRFPRNILAGMFEFERKAYFQASEGAEQAPKVEFDFTE